MNGESLPWRQTQRPVFSYPSSSPTDPSDLSGTVRGDRSRVRLRRYTCSHDRQLNDVTFVAERRLWPSRQRRWDRHIQRTQRPFSRLASRSNDSLSSRRFVQRRFHFRGQSIGQCSTFCTSGQSVVHTMTTHISSTRVRKRKSLPNSRKIQCPVRKKFSSPMAIARICLVC